MGGKLGRNRYYTTTANRFHSERHKKKALKRQRNKRATTITLREAEIINAFTTYKKGGTDNDQTDGTIRNKSKGKRES